MHHYWLTAYCKECKKKVQIENPQIVEDKKYSKCIVYEGECAEHKIKIRRYFNSVPQDPKTETGAPVGDSNPR